MWVPRGKDLVCFSSFSDRADDGEATTLELGVCGGMWVWTRLMSVCKTCGSGICQQAGTTTVQKRHQMSQENVICPLCPALLFFPAPFQFFSLHVALKEEGRWAGTMPVKQMPRKGRESPWQWQEGRETHTGKVWTSTPFMGRICYCILLDSILG